MSNFSYASNLVITGGNFGTVGGNINNYTFTGGNQPFPPVPLPLDAQRATEDDGNPQDRPAITHGQVQSPPSTLPATSPPNSNAGSLTSSPGSTSGSLSPANSGRPHQDESDGSETSSYSTAPSFLPNNTLVQTPPSTNLAPPTSPWQHRPASTPTNGLSPLSVQLNQFASPTALYETPKPQHPDVRYDSPLGYQHTQQSIPDPMRRPPSRAEARTVTFPVPQSPRYQYGSVPPAPPHHQPDYAHPATQLMPPVHANESYYDSRLSILPRSQYEYQPLVGYLQVGNSNPNDANSYPAPSPASTSPQPPTPIGAGPGEEGWDPSAEFARLQRLKPTKGYSSRLSTDPFPATRDNFNNNNATDNAYTRYEDRDYQPYRTRTPTNDLGIYTTPSQPNIPPVSALTRSYSPKPPSPQTKQARTTPPQPRSSQSSSFSTLQNPQTLPPWTTDTAIADWAHEVKPYEHRNWNPSPPGESSAIHVNNGTYPRSYTTDVRAQMRRSPSPISNTAAHAEYGDTGTAAPYAPRENYPRGGPYSDSYVSGSAPAYGHFSPFTQQAPNSPAYGHISPFMQQAPGSPVLINTSPQRDRYSVMENQMGRREPGFAFERLSLST